MKMNCPGHSRRHFLGRSLPLAVGFPLAWPWFPAAGAGEAAIKPSHSPALAQARVAILSCRGYGAEVRRAMKEAFDLLGGIGSLVRNKTVTVKINLTGTSSHPFLGRPAGETWMTHFSTALALGGLLAESGARRIRFVESTQSRENLESTLLEAGWDVNALRALGRIEFENTRNLGRGKSYAKLGVPGGGLFFSAFHLNHAYEETDVMVSLCKLKQHLTTGVTLSMKNLFGITPNSIYGDEAGSEEATGGRGPLHEPGNPLDPKAYAHIPLPETKQKQTEQPTEAGLRVPRIITDLCAARPIHLAVIDGITSLAGGEGWWCGEAGELSVVSPGVIIAGLNPVATDAVGTAVMGFSNPRAGRGEPPFGQCENHLLLAEQAGLGPADLQKIDLRGLTLEKAIHPFRKPGSDKTAPQPARDPIMAEPE
ncbi:MAG: DUF362 domain-containing protein [Verrucomicrobia bacterium]|nr:DUF362 domain-containing protein [Verrucomicrobiota bacterium]